MLTEVLALAKLLIPLAIVLISTIGGIIFEKRVIKRLHAIALRTGWSGYDIILSSLRGVALLWFILTGFFCASFSLDLSPTLRVLFDKSLMAMTLVSSTIVIARLAVGFIGFYSDKGDDVSPITSLFENLTKLAIFSIGLLIVIQSLGISITPLLTALGVGGVSIGLALQNTLANLFSGLNIILSRKVRPGDYIELSTGEAGYVTDVEWRYTVIQDLTQNQLVVPNSRIVSAAFKNYGLPNRTLSIQVRVGVDYHSDLEKVEAVTLEVAREIQRDCTYAIDDCEPFLLFENFGYFSIDFVVFIRVREYFEGLKVRHRFIKMLHERYKQEGIKIPFPIATGYLPERNPGNRSTFSEHLDYEVQRKINNSSNDY